MYVIRFGAILSTLCYVNATEYYTFLRALSLPLTSSSVCVCFSVFLFRFVFILLCVNNDLLLTLYGSFAVRCAIFFKTCCRFFFRSLFFISLLLLFYGISRAFSLS